MKISREGTEINEKKLKIRSANKERSEKERMREGSGQRQRIEGKKTG